jgi:hypothetical protein
MLLIVFRSYVPTGHTKVNRTHPYTTFIALWPRKTCPLAVQHGVFASDHPPGRVIFFFFFFFYRTRSTTTYFPRCNQLNTLSPRPLKLENLRRALPLVSSHTRAIHPAGRRGSILTVPYSRNRSTGPAFFGFGFGFNCNHELLCHPVIHRITSLHTIRESNQLDEENKNEASYIGPNRNSQ